MTAILSCLQNTHISIFHSAKPSPKTYSQVVASSSMNQYQPIKTQFSSARQLISDFPHLLRSQKEILSTVISIADDSFGSLLHPSSLSVPPDVESYQNAAGSSLGFLNINRGVDASSVDFLLTNCMHLTLPTGSIMNIVTLQGHLKPTTDAPHLVLEVCHFSPSNVLVCLDLTPRKDLILHPEYLKEFYEEGGLEECRKAFYERIPEAEPYVSSSMHVRSVMSPTGILAMVKCGDRTEEILREGVAPVAAEVVRIWAVNCARERRASEGETRELERRDMMLKKKSVELDLAPKLPAIFGEDVANRVIRVITNVYGT